MALNRTRVLLVEDSRGQARLLGEILAEVPSMRFALTHVERLGEAQRLLREEHFDVVLLDLGLPDSQGLETFLNAHQHSPDVPIVVLTDLDDETLAVKAVQEGAQDYLVKGQADGEILVRSIRYAIERQMVSHYSAMMMEWEHFDLAVSQVTDGIVITDGEWRITAANRAACLLLNFPEEGWREMPLDDALGPFELSAPLNDLRSSSERFSEFEIARTHTKPPLYLNARLTRLLGSRGDLANVVLTLRDVTAERRAQKLRADFFTMVSHKLRTPLSVLRGCLGLLRQLTGERLLDRRDGLIDICQAEVRRLEDLVRELLQVKALSSEQLRTDAPPTDLARVMDQVVEVVRARYPSKELEITPAVATNAVHTEASIGHVHFVFDRILDNAAKFGGADAVRIHITVERKDPSWLVVDVADNGPGIPHEYRDRILEGFVQVEDRVTGQVAGLGVGLFMARQVVEAYGGTISVQSRIGEGSTVSFSLPAASPSRLTPTDGDGRES